MRLYSSKLSGYITCLFYDYDNALQKLNINKNVKRMKIFNIKCKELN